MFVCITDAWLQRSSSQNTMFTKHSSEPIPSSLKHMVKVNYHFYSLVAEIFSVYLSSVNLYSWMVAFVCEVTVFIVLGSWKFPRVHPRSWSTGMMKNNIVRPKW